MSHYQSDKRRQSKLSYERGRRSAHSVLINNIKDELLLQGVDAPALGSAEKVLKEALIALQKSQPPRQPLPSSSLQSLDESVRPFSSSLSPRSNHNAFLYN